MAVDLRFRLPLDTSHPVDLVFGLGDPVLDVTAMLAATLPAPVMSLAVYRLVVGYLAATLPAPIMVAETVYDNAVFRGVVGSTATGWQDGNAVEGGSGFLFQNADPLPAEVAAGWQDGARAEGGSAIHFQSADPLPAEVTADWQDGVKVVTDRGQRFSDMLREPRPELRQRYQDALRLGTDRYALWQDRHHRPRPGLVSRWQDGTPMQKWASAPFAAGTSSVRWWETGWQDAMHPPPGRFEIIIEPIPGPESCYTPPNGLLVALRFKELLLPGTGLRFRCDHGEDVADTIIVPVRRTYIVINDVTLIRVSDSLDIPVYGLSLSIEADSWTWKWSASIPAAMKTVIEGSYGDPVELLATINGQGYRLIAESMARDRAFGDSRITVSGRGRAAFLAEPYSPFVSVGNSESRTAQQLMADVLSINGVSLGWEIDFRIMDWVVPANVFRHNGRYITGVTEICQAVGAYVLPHPTDQVLRIMPRYPAGPWEWNDLIPDVVLPSSACRTEGIVWVDNPDYNAVFVSGMTQGVVAKVQITGTGGDRLAPMATSSLITQEAAARQRGTAILGATGRQANVSLSLPVLSGVGVLEPGKIVQYTDGAVTRLGVVRGVKVGSAFPKVEQTLELECHE